MRIYKKWWFCIIIILLIVLILVIFFYPKRCGGLISKAPPTSKDCSCFGFLREICLHPYFVYDYKTPKMCLDSAPTTVCFGICLKNTCKTNS